MIVNSLKCFVGGLFLWNYYLQKNKDELNCTENTYLVLCVPGNRNRELEPKGYNGSDDHDKKTRK